MLGVIRGRILTPESAGWVVERARRQLEQGRAAADPEADRRRLAELDAKIERVVELAVERVLDLRRAFEGAPEESRSALRVLLDGERMRVYADADQAFRVEGVYRLALENGTDRNLDDSGRFDCLVAGGGATPEGVRAPRTAIAAGGWEGGAARRVGVRRPRQPHSKT